LRTRATPVLGALVALALVREAGYVLAVMTAPGSLQNAREPLLLHRYEVLDSTGVSGLAAIVRD
jgi:hypothetical protein